MGSQQSIVAQGESVKEGQKLMRIPDLRRMLVNTKVHEALVSRIKGDVWQPTGFVDTLRAAMFVHPDPLSRMVGQYAMPEIREKLRDHEMQKVSDGMRATIRVDAFPDKVLRGHVKSVATVAAKQDWNSADVKVYQTMIVIEESLDGLKPDMTAEVTIHVDSTGEPVLTVPLQAVIGGTELGRTRKVFVSTTEGPKERDVLIGLSNEKVVEIREGLQENDEVVLNPKVILGDKAKTRQVIDSDRSDGGEGKAKGKGKGGKGKGRSGGPGGPGGGMIPSGPDGGLPGNGGGEAK
jgi:stress response protein YsnF